MNSLISILEIGKPNMVGNIYTRKSLITLMKLMKSRIDQNIMFGVAMGAPGEEWDESKDSRTIDLKKITHKINSVKIMESFLVADVSFMETSMGKAAYDMVSSGECILRPTITGKVNPETREIEIHELLSFDVIFVSEGLNVDVEWIKINNN
jgi:hypothetical protein